MRAFQGSVREILWLSCVGVGHRSSSEMCSVEHYQFRFCFINNETFIWLTDLSCDTENILEVKIIKTTTQD